MTESLEMLFSSAARVQVLQLFLQNPEESFFQREIERRTGQPIRAVQREVARLVEMDLLQRTMEGKRVFYRVNPDFALLPELTDLVQKAAGAAVGERPEKAGRAIPPDPSTVSQPFPWMETPAQPQLPDGLRQRQVGTEWDRAY